MEVDEEKLAMGFISKRPVPININSFDKKRTFVQYVATTAGNMQRLAVILMFVVVRLLPIREALILPYDGKLKDDKPWNEKTLVNKVVSEEEWKVLRITHYENRSLPKSAQKDNNIGQAIPHHSESGWLV